MFWESLVMHVLSLMLLCRILDGGISLYQRVDSIPLAAMMIAERVRIRIPNKVSF